MSRHDAAIDLGTMSRGRVPEPGPVPARVWRHRRRVAAAVVVAALVTVTVTGAGGPSRPALEPHFTVPPIGSFAFSHDTLYLLTSDEAAASDGDGGTAQRTGRPEALRAYRLADGAERWETQLPDVVGGPRQLAVFEGTPVLTRADLGTEGLQWRTTVFDRATGEPQWTRDCIPIAGSDGRLLLSDVDVPPGLDSAAEACDLTAVSMAAGQVEWTLTLPDGRSHTTADGRHLVHRDGDGQLSSYDLATGQMLATVDGVGATERWTVAGSLVLTTDNAGVLTAYDVDTLTTRWTTTGLPVDAEATGCGPLVCVSTSQDRPKTLDSADGALVWRADWVERDRPFVLRPDPTGGDDHLVLADDGGPGDMVGNLAWLVEAHSGQPVLNLRGWYPDQLVLGHLPGSEQTAVLPYYYDEDADRTWLGRWHTDPPEVEVLDSIDGRAICLTRAAYVLCHGSVDADNEPQVQVWRLRGEGR